MIYKRLVLLLAWTVLWGGFAVDQLLLTYGHMQSRNIYGDKVMIERDGKKFLVDKEMIANKKIKSANYDIDTYKKIIYVYGISQNEEERTEVINEAKQVLDVEDVVTVSYTHLRAHET